MEGICVKKQRFKLSACQLESKGCSVSLFAVSVHAPLSSLANLSWPVLLKRTVTLLGSEKSWARVVASVNIPALVCVSPSSERLNQLELCSHRNHKINKNISNTLCFYHEVKSCNFTKITLSFYGNEDIILRVVLYHANKVII